MNYFIIFCFIVTLLKKDGDDGARYILLRKKDKVFYELESLV